MGTPELVAYMQKNFGHGQTWKPDTRPYYRDSVVTQVPGVPLDLVIIRDETKGTPEAPYSWSIRTPAPQDGCVRPHRGPPGPLAGTGYISLWYRTPDSAYACMRRTLLRSHYGECCWLTGKKR